MVRNAGTCLYKEARLNIEPAFPGSTISFTLPAKSANAIGFSTRPKRTVYDEKDTGSDDDAFTKRHLANDGSVYFRRRHTYPRSFLWRMLDERKTLEIQAVDLENDERSTHEADLTLLLHFSSPIRPFCVAFAEQEDQNSITVFAITTTNELYTMCIPCAFFSKEVASEVEIEHWCKRSTPALLHANTPYRLVAVGIDQLLVSLDNGSILRLLRENKDDILWTEATFQHSNWSLTLRGVLPWKGQQTVRFGNTDLVASTAANMSLSPDGSHIICVCLDHTLRMFNLQSGRMTRQQDLLDIEDDAQDRNQSHLLGSSQPRLMQIVEVTGAANVSYFVIVYSPIRHEFKFYGVRSSDAAPEAFVDIQPDFSFVPPIDDLMNATVWTLEEFFIVPSGSGWKGTTLWLRARSGPSSRVFSIMFDPSDDSERLPRVWHTDWTTVDSGPLTIEGLRKEPTNPGEQDWDASELYEVDITEKWLDFLFVPGRFTIATLETALFILRKGLDGDRGPARLKGLLKDRLCATIAEAARKHAPEDTTENYEQLIAIQWDAYYGLVKDLHKRRGESLSLAYDPVADQPWVVLSDCLSAIRKCSEPESILNNSDVLTNRLHPSGPLRKALQKPEAQSLEVRRLLNAASSFRRRLPASFQRDLKRDLHADLLQSRSVTVIDRMEQMEADCDLTSVVTEDDLASLIEDLGNGINHLSTEVFQSAIRALKFERKGGQPRSTQSARYGLKALLRIASETLDFNYETLLDLLVLILFMQFEEDISDDFDASVVFFDLMNEFKDWIVLDWIATTVWSHQTPTGRSSTRWMKEFHDASKTSSRFPITQTALEGMFGYGATSIPMPGNLKTGFLTYWGQGWLASIFSAQQGQTFDSVVEDMMGKLLFQKEYDLAKDFSKFLPESNWASYLKALGIGFSVDMADTARLVPETEQDLFSDGLPKYYSHVLGLFEKAKAYSFMADYARLGLNSMIGFEDEILRTELLQRLFTASIQTSRFEEAYTAMTRHSDSALKLSSLKSLVTSMVAQAQTAALLKFPLVGLVEEMDTILSDLCQKTLNIGSGPPYHQILYSFRVSRGNFRGAATILYERLQRLKSTSSKIHDPADESLIHCYLMIINALSSVSPQDAYILADQRIDEGIPQFLHGPIGTAKKLLKRHIVTLDTLRKEYQAELDRVAAIENGHFAFMDPADEMDIL
ncbi:uncharacterized protein N0V89_005028 [Didymosphaeria variabile]|uniref:Nucleoporin Nup120/160-domain-containing protein n=1 Tax=Didymosphaeria variabile TaxID=1932322 RepID=A0A9W9CA36_9PLEO|nr:uncharacterized protein N0V89_005028 [Didymosphaeria variabile]KAJ4353301.1 hypothetical protein N0V89_005028 [Didymosphaeria variabile]